MKILLIEDDREISLMLQSFLSKENFEVITALDGESACELFDLSNYDLVLLDLMLPKINGIDVMNKIREKSNIPIIIISAKDTDSDKILGLGLGADDYITKPFSLIEVLARIKANIRRSVQYSGEHTCIDRVIKKGALRLYVDNYTIYKNNIRLDLTAKEFEIIKLLLLNPQRVYTKEQIYSLIWKDVYCGDENAVNVHISRLRNKIEDNPKKPQYIQTVWGIGYKLGD